MLLYHPFASKDAILSFRKQAQSSQLIQLVQGLLSLFASLLVLHTCTSYLRYGEEITSALNVIFWGLDEITLEIVKEAKKYVKSDQLDFNPA